MKGRLLMSVKKHLAAFSNGWGVVKGEYEYRVKGEDKELGSESARYKK